MEHILDWSKAYQRYFEEMTVIPHGSGLHKNMD